MTSDPVKHHILSQFGKRQMTTTPQSLAEAIREHRETCVILAIKASQSDADGEKIRAELDAADDKLLSALSSHAETAGGWRPIETAPKDRKAVQLYVPENKCVYTAIWVEQRGWWEIFGGDWRAHLQRASHWMPLSPPPQSSAMIKAAKGGEI